MEKILISIPDPLAARMRSIIPSGERSKIISAILEEEIKRREEALYAAALAVENDEELNSEMSDWEVTLNDGFD
jgi:metal-responsive CopG/Arc/MetJ family transcriptional regulator